MKIIFSVFLVFLLFSHPFLFADDTSDATEKFLQLEKQLKTIEKPAERVKNAMKFAREFYKQTSDASGSMRLLDSVSDIVTNEMSFLWNLEKSAYFDSFAASDVFLLKLLKNKDLLPEQRYRIYGKRVELIRCYRESDVTPLSIWEEAASDPLLEKTQQLNVLLARAALLPPEKRIILMNNFSLDESLSPFLLGNYHSTLGMAWRQRVNCYTEPLASSFYEKSVHAFQKAFESDQNSKTLFLLAETQFLAGNFDGAETSLRLLLSMKLSDNNRLAAECLSGRITLKRGDYQTAYERLKEALKPEQQNLRSGATHESYAALGEAAFALEKYSEALSALELAQKSGRGWGRNYYAPAVNHLKKLISGLQNKQEFYD